GRHLNPSRSLGGAWRMGSQQVLAGSANGQVGPVREPPILPVAQEFMMKIKKERLTQKDVKNEDRPDYVYENKG
ncbi:MAG: hypothetical protein ABSF14_04115, partial [Terriglobia bacterium]